MQARQADSLEIVPRRLSQEKDYDTEISFLFDVFTEETARLVERARRAGSSYNWELCTSHRSSWQDELRSTKEKRAGR